MIIADDRESPELLFILKRTCKVEIRRLNPGDYVIWQNGVAVGVERKTFSDLLSSLASGRLEEQLERLRRAYVKTYLLIEGLIEWSVVRNPNWLCSVLQRIVKEGTYIISSYSQENSSYILRNLEKNSDQERDCPIPVMIQKSCSVSQVQHRVLCALPGIGVRKARMLLEKFGSVRAIFLAKRSELKDAGIGRKTSKKLMNFLDEKYGK